MNCRRSSALLALPLLTGCATVTSMPAAQNELRSGVSYYLPKREARFSADRKILKKAELEKALAGAKAKVAAADQAATELKTALEKQEKLVAISNLATPAGVEAERQRATLAAQKTLADADLKLAQSAEKDAEAALALLGAQDGAACAFLYTAKVELLAPIADTRQRFVADLSHSIFRDDELKLAVNSAGLLTSANVIAADRTGDILVEIAGAISGLGGSGGAALQVEGDRAKTVNCDQLPTKFVYQFDPAADGVATDGAATSPIAISGDGAAAGSVAGLNRALAAAKYPFRVSVSGLTERDVTARQFADPDRVGYNRGKRLPLGEAAGFRGRYGALFYPTPVPATLLIWQCKTTGLCAPDSGLADPVEAALIMLPQAGPVSYIPMQSSAFVKTVDDVKFDNGVIASWDASRPSELLEVVRLPVKILTSIVSVPAQLFSLRVNLSDQEKALAESQKAQIDAQTQLATLKACIDTAEREERSAAACFAAQ